MAIFDYVMLNRPVFPRHRAAIIHDRNRVSMSSKRFTEDLRIEAVKQVTERGHSMSDVASRLGISTHSLYAWRKRDTNASAMHHEDLTHTDAHFGSIVRIQLLLTLEQDPPIDQEGSVGAMPTA